VVCNLNVIAIGYYLNERSAVLLSQNLIPDMVIIPLLCEINKCNPKDIEFLGMKIVTIMNGGEK
jgi:hypothetical protein